MGERAHLRIGPQLEHQAQVLADATEAQTRGWNEAADLLERVEARISRSLSSKREVLDNPADLTGFQLAARGDPNVKGRH